MGNRQKKQGNSARTILIPVDFSEVAVSAIGHGIRIASLNAASVCLLHVYNLHQDTVFNKKDPACLTAIHQLADYKSTYEEMSGITIETLIRPGNLFKVINQAVRDLKPWLMVMGTHGKQGLQQLFGSYALRVVLDVTCPILVVQRDPPADGYRQIVVPVISQANPSGIIRWLKELCGEETPVLHLLQALENDAELNEAIRSVTGKFFRIAREAGCRVALTMAGSTQDFACQVIDQAATCDADLIVTMTTPAATTTGYMLSDWNERLMFNPQKVPVLFVDQG